MEDADVNTDRRCPVGALGRTDVVLRGVSNGVSTDAKRKPWRAITGVVARQRDSCHVIDTRTPRATNAALPELTVEDLKSK